MRLRWTEPAVRTETVPKLCGALPSEPPMRLTRLPCSLAGRPGRKPGTRELILPGLPWLAVYRVGEDVVEIRGILHGAQRFP